MGNTFSPPNTKCNDCVFHDVGDVLDCETGARKHYRDKGVIGSIIDSNTELKFEPVVILHNFLCPYKRDKAWLEANSENTADKLNLEVTTLPYVVVVLDHDTQTLKQTLDRIYEYDNQPQEIFVVIRADRPDPNTVLAMKPLFNDFQGKWHIFFQLDNESWQEICKFNKREEFVLLVTGYPEVDNNWPRTTGSKIQNELLKFPYAENDVQSMTLIHPYYFNAFFFDYGKNWLEELKKQTCNLKYKL